MSGSCSDSMLMVPLVWKPPIRTSVPWARSSRPRSSARGNWSVVHHQPHHQLGGRLPGPPRIFRTAPSRRSCRTRRLHFFDVPEHPLLGNVDRQSVEDVQGVAREHAPPEPEDVPVIVVLGRLDEAPPGGFVYRRASGAGGVGSPREDQGRRPSLSAVCRHLGCECLFPLRRSPDGGSAQRTRCRPGSDASFVVRAAAEREEGVP